MTDSSMYNFDQVEQQLGALARTMIEDDWSLEAPPPDLFSAILAEVRADGAVGQTPPPVHRQAPPTPVNHFEQQQVEQQASFRPAEQFEQPAQAQFQPHTQPQVSHQQQSAPYVEQPSAEVPSLDAHREAKTARRSGPTWLLAAAAVAVLAIGGGLLANQFGSDEPAGVTVASAAIVNDELPVTFGQSGTAVLVNEDGDLVLDIDVPELPDAGEAFYEVWMIDTNVEGMISLGVLTADGRIDVPDSVNPGDFPVVDVSVEPLDGDPTHSGQSILRGVLDV